MRTEKSAHGLVVFDLDGTLIRGSTVCELLAEPLGKLSRMQQFEKLKTEDEIILARIEMASWYADIPRTRLIESLEAARLAPGTLEGIGLLQSHGLECAIASITWSFAVEWFAGRLGIRHFTGVGIGAFGELRHVWPKDKGTWVTMLAESLGIPRERVATVGDSWRDLEMFQAGSTAIFVGEDSTGLPETITVVPTGDILSAAKLIVKKWMIS